MQKNSTTASHLFCIENKQFSLNISTVTIEKIEQYCTIVEMSVQLLSHFIA